jgi:hypothetical protein
MGIWKRNLPEKFAKIANMSFDHAQFEQNGWLELWRLICKNLTDHAHDQFSGACSTARLEQTS